MAMALATLAKCFTSATRKLSLYFVCRLVTVHIAAFLFLLAGRLYTIYTCIELDTATVIWSVYYIYTCIELDTTTVISRCKMEVLKIMLIPRVDMLTVVSWGRGWGGGESQWLYYYCIRN